MYIFGIIGLIIASYAIWVRNEKRRDLWFVVGGICLLAYSISIGSLIFTILQLVFIASATMEMVKLKKKK
jgi:hypothetical protein